MCQLQPVVCGLGYLEATGGHSGNCVQNITYKFVINDNFISEIWQKILVKYEWRSRIIYAEKLKKVRYYFIILNLLIN
jgi:hypothetical protein